MFFWQNAGKIMLDCAKKVTRQSTMSIMDVPTTTATNNSNKENEVAK
jgi:hypothetical protein